MHHLILGYGYCGYYLAQELLGHHQQVTVVSRQLKKELELSKIQHISHDLEYPFHWNEPDSIIYYLIPPSSQGTCDTFLQRFLNQSSLNAKKLFTLVQVESMETIKEPGLMNYQLVLLTLHVNKDDWMQNNNGWPIVSNTVESFPYCVLRASTDQTEFQLMRPNRKFQ